MKSKSFKAFVKMMEKDGSLIEISQYKKTFPEEYDCYHAAYERARNECMKCHNNGIAGYTTMNYMNIDNIMKQSQSDKSIRYPDLPYEEAKQKAAEIDARNERIQSGSATHEDYVSIKNELYSSKGR